MAEDAEKVNADLVVRDAEGEAYTVRYEAVNAMLLNEFLKEHRKRQLQDRKIREQQATFAEPKKALEDVGADLKEQDSKIQKVSARLELQPPPTQTVATSQ